ncbi:MAG: glutathione S-transferase N-terminal domain-containing protein [Pseudomonadota bacterium]
MKLYAAHISPYSRLVQMLILEKGLGARVEIEFRPTRMPDNPLYAIQPSGRIPTFVTDDGDVYEDSALICAYLDHLDGAPAFERPPVGAARWRYWQAEARARSLVDGLSVWQREIYRPSGESSQAVVAHETARAMRFADAFEALIGDEVWLGDINVAQLLLIIGLQMQARLPAFAWQTGRPALTAWAERMARRESVSSTVPSD